MAPSSGELQGGEEVVPSEKDSDECGSIYVVCGWVANTVACTQITWPSLKLKISAPFQSMDSVMFASHHYGAFYNL